MKKILLVFGLTGIIGLCNIQAQDIPARPHDGVHAKAAAKDIYKDLNLTQDQKKALKDISQDAHARLAAIRNDNTLSQEQKKAKLLSLRDEEKSKRNAILTTEQRAKLDEKMKAFAAKKKDWKPAAAAYKKGMDHEKWMEELKLTDSQKEKLQALRTEGKSKMQSIKNNQNLTQEQKKAAFRDFMKEQKTKRDAVLTPEQRQLMDAKMKEMQKTHKKDKLSN